MVLTWNINELNLNNFTMNKITHMIDKDGNVVIDALWDGNTYGAVLNPSRTIGGITYIKKSSIDTFGLDNPEEKKDEIVKSITTQRGKYNEAPLVVEER